MIFACRLAVLPLLPTIAVAPVADLLARVEQHRATLRPRGHGEKQCTPVNKTYYDYNDYKRMKGKPDLDFFEEPFWVSFNIDEYGSNLL